jgi:hypothetical protein
MADGMSAGQPRSFLLNGPMVDIFLTIAIAGLTIGITVWAVFLKNPGPWHKVGFIGLGWVMLLLITWQADRTAEREKTFEAKIDQIRFNMERSTQILGFMQVEDVTVPTISAPLLSPNVPNLLNVSWTNKGTHQISDVRQFTKLKYVQKKNDNDAFQEFREEVKGFTQKSVI